MSIRNEFFSLKSIQKNVRDHPNKAPAMFQLSLEHYLLDTLCLLRADAVQFRGPCYRYLCLLNARIRKKTSCASVSSIAIIMVWKPFKTFSKGARPFSNATTAHNSRGKPVFLTDFEQGRLQLFRNAKREGVLVI